jgi:hypothetical protein
MSDTIHFLCEGCGKNLKVPRERAGRKVKCACGKVQRGPDAAVSATTRDAVAAGAVQSEERWLYDKSSTTITLWCEVDRPEAVRNPDGSSGSSFVARHCRICGGLGPERVRFLAIMAVK